VSTVEAPIFADAKTNIIEIEIQILAIFVIKVTGIVTLSL